MKILGKSKGVVTLIISVLSGNIRNLAMEKVASSVLFPCKYATIGCVAVLHHTEKTDHEETCDFRSDPDASLCLENLSFSEKKTGLKCPLLTSK